MNHLYVTTQPTRDHQFFYAYWMTGLETRGRVQVRVPEMVDARTAAELAAIEHLLVAKNACGHNKAGSGLVLHVSCSAIIELMSGKSVNQHLSPFATFLRTRFLGAEIVYEEPPFTWANELCDTRCSTLEITRPEQTVIEVAGFGPCELTVHAVESYVRRFERPAQKAWKELVQLAKRVVPVKLLRRHVVHDVKHRRVGTHLYHPGKKLILVVTPSDREGLLPRVVTVFQPQTDERLDVLASPTGTKVPASRIPEQTRSNHPATRGV